QDGVFVHQRRDRKGSNLLDRHGRVGPDAAYGGVLGGDLTLPRKIDHADAIRTSSRQWWRLGVKFLRCWFSANSPRATESMSMTCTGMSRRPNRLAAASLRAPAMRRPSGVTTIGWRRPISSMLAARPAMSPMS